MPERITEVDKLDQAIGHWLAGIRTAVPAIVVAYNEVTNLVIVKRTRRSASKDGTPYEEQPWTVPACWHSFGGWFIAGDLGVGDEGVVLVSDRELGEWLERGGVVDPVSSHTHALHDGMFVPILRNKRRPLPARGGKLVIGREDGSASLSIGKDGTITLHGATKIELGESASQALVKGDAFKALYNAHTHDGVTVGAGVTGTPSATFKMDVVPNTHTSAKTKTA